MKLHLPVSLFRAVMTLLSYTVGVAATTQILYGAAPDDAVEVVLINPEDLSRPEHTVNDREFLVKADLIFDGVNSPYMGPDAESWFFSGSPEISINFINATDQVFDVAESMTLEFEIFEEISFKNEGQTDDTNPGGAIYGEENSSITLSKIDTITFSGNRAKFFRKRHNDSYFYAEAYGGAISGTTVILSDNGSIEFSKNTATASHQYSDFECAYGGAISGTTVILSDNVSIEFSENTATTSDLALAGDYDYAYGGAIYGKTIRMSGNGSVIFNGNKARSFTNYHYDETYGGAIHGTTIELSDNESLLFSYNTAISYGSSRGGAISGTAITISGNGMVEFYSNEASTSAARSYTYVSSYGGAIYGSTVTLRGNDNVVFRMNRATTSNDQCAEDLRGGAIHGGIITLNDNGSVIFSENTTSVFNDYGNRYGGAIYGGNNSSIMLSNNGNVEFSGNNVNDNVNGSYSAYGGAIYGADDSSITLNHNESVTFSSNTAMDGGGAIYGGNGSTITLNHNGSVTFNENASCAIVGTTVTLSNNGNVSFNGNSAFSYHANNGGAIAGKDITLSNNGSVTFSENSAKFDGGAIEGTTVTLNDNISVSFNGNSLSATGKCTGGAIEGTTITLNNNSIVSFSGNSVRGTGEYAESYGGAIYGGVGSSLTLSNNSSVTFNGNSVNDDGGAIYGAGSIEISNNGCVTFSENSASGDGGAIYGYSLYSSIAISNNGSVTFSGNSASNGGAIYLGRHSNLAIQNNDSVLFEKNYSNYRPLSIYAYGSSSTITLSAPAGKSIEFRDSVYIGSGTTVNLNADYTDANGVVHKQQGDIIFTGKYAEAHLNEILEADGSGRVATADEIRNSRTTKVYATTNLYGGRLSVEDGAIYTGCGITAHAGSDSTIRVKDAELKHGGYNMILNSGTSLELEGYNIILGDITMHEDSTLQINLADSPSITDICGNLNFLGDVTLVLSDDSEGAYKNRVLMYIIGEHNGWNEDTLTVSDAGKYGSSNVTWVDNMLVLNYDSTTFPTYFNGCAEYNSTHDGGTVILHHYETLRYGDTNGIALRGSGKIWLNSNGSITFNGNTASTSSSSAFGSAIHGSGAISLSNNESVTFSGNTASAYSSYIAYDAYGGAIHGSRDISLSNNGSVTFSGNTVSAYSANGGAIHGSGDISLSNNESVTFSGNTASASSAAYGGAIHGNGDISLSNNRSVTFSGNSASSSFSNAYGGAIHGSGDISLNNNGSVVFEGNTTSSSSDDAYGGAIYGSGDISLSNNGSVTFSGNTASTYSSSYYYSAFGGAIQAIGNLSIRNNNSVLFEKNAEKSGRNYQLRSLHMNGYYSDNFSLSTSEGNSIEFRDSVYVCTGVTISLNQDYTYKNAVGESVTIKQTGDIIFTGKYAETHLHEILEAAGAGRVATAEEILNSRTSEVYAMTNLYGGRLCVEDGAVYKGYGITAHAGSDSTIRVKDAELNHGGYNIILNSGTSLELEGENKITAHNLVLNGGSSLRYILDGKENHPAMTLTGNLSLLGDVSLQLDREMDYGVYQLMTCSSISGDISQLAADMPEHYELAWHANALDLIVWEHMQLTNDESNLSFTRGAVKAVAEHDLEYRSVTMDDGLYQISGEGSLGVSEVLSVTGGADVTLALATVAAGVEVGDDSSLSLQKGLNLVSLMTLDDEETEAAKAISVGRNAELSLTDAALLGQVATADETSAVYYQTETGDKLLKFTGDLGNGGLNLTLGEDGKTVSATDSAGFTGNITVLSGTTLVNEATSTTDGLPFGDNYATAADKTITVQGDATLDINGRETYYHLVLEKDALLTNSGTDAHRDWKGVPVIDLSGDAEVNAAAQICMVGANYASTTLNLNGNTLTKTGSANLVLRNTSINEGTLAVNGGLVRFMGNTSTVAGTGIQVNKGGTLWISEGTGNYAGSLVLNTGGHVYLGEGPSGTLGGDNGTDSQTISLTGLGKLKLAGGTMTFRGEKLNMGTVDVTAASTLELWDQTGSNGVATTASTISTLNMSANLNLATTWKSSLDIARLTGRGELLVGSSREKHKVSVQDLSGFTGTFAIRGANSTLSLNLSGDDEMNAARVTKDDSAVLILEGSGTYCFSNLENVTAAATGISDIQFGDTWSGKIALRNSTAIGMELDDFGGAGKTIVIEGVSGWFAYNRTVESHLQLVESGLTLLDTSRKTYTYTGGISGSGDFTIKSKADNTYTGTYNLSGDLSAWDGAFRVQQSEDNTNTAPVNLNLTGGGTLFSGTDGCGVLMERTGDMNVTIGNAGTATTMRGDIRNVGVTYEGVTTYGTVNVTLNNTVDAQGDIIASRINVGAGADINFSGTVQADRWMVGKDASLCLGTGAVVYLSEAPNGVMEGDLQTDDRGTLELTEATVELAGGRLSYRGKNMAMGEVNVTSDSVLEIWDQTGSNGVAGTACTIDSLNLDAALTQTTTCKCTLEIDTLTGSGPLAIQSRNEKHNVEINDISGYTGEITISNANTTLALNLGKDVVLDASRVTKDDDSTLVLAGTGSYNIGTGRGIAAGVTFAEGWQGSVRLTGTLAGETLSGLSDEDSWVELYGVSGYLSQADAAAGAQTYGMNLKLTDAGETAAWNLNNGWNGDVRTFTGMVCGTGTLNRNHYMGSEQTLIFAGDVSGWSGALEHNATSATNNGQKVKTNVTFNGSSEINVAMRTNGKGELNVTLDDANLAAGSKVTVNNAVSATNFTVTEGTAAKLNNTLQVSGVVELMAAASLELGEVVSLSAGAGSAQLNTVSLNSTGIRGTGDASSLTNLQMQNLSGSFAVADVALHEVEISGSNSALTLSNVSLDDSCTIDLGTAGTVTFDNSTLCLTVPELSWDGSEVLHIDCSALLTGNALGNLLIDVNHSVDEIVNLGYQTVAVDFGANVNTTNLNLNLSQAQFKGFVGSIAQFNLVPEPTTATLSLLALAALAARRRRK